MKVILIRKVIKLFKNLTGRLLTIPIYLFGLEKKKENSALPYQPKNETPEEHKIRQINEEIHKQVLRKMQETGWDFEDAKDWIMKRIKKRAAIYNTYLKCVICGKRGGTFINTEKGYKHKDC